MIAGQKVVCVDDSPARADGEKELLAGTVYTVRWSSPEPIACVRLHEVQRDEPARSKAFGCRNNADHPFAASRFRALN